MRQLADFVRRLSSRQAERQSLAGETGDRYDVFISYSRSDREFAEVLEGALENYRPPKRSGLPESPLRAFRDTSDFTGNEYTLALQRHLESSRKLLVLCSPRSRESPYVNEEIRTLVSG